MRRTSTWLVGGGALAAAAVAAAACSSSSDADEKVLPRAELFDPGRCGQCHTDHYREWSGSMHAYASDDPVFLAMNARLQRETGGALKDFCVKCHAPMALLEGATTDGLNLADVPRQLKGVTCFFCHNVDRVEGSHNNGLVLSNDSTMHGPFTNPVKNGVHRSVYSANFDGDRVDSAKTCGSCHDIVTPDNAHIERTFAEWQGSVFAKEFDPNNPALPTGATCNQCHMVVSRSKGPVATGVAGVGNRERHSHTFAAIDTAITPWPEIEAQKAEITELLQARTLQSALCVGELAGAHQIQVVLHNLGAGHSFPSGASSDRRVWTEIVAYAGESVLYSTGTKLYGDRSDPAAKIELVPEAEDPDLLLFRDCHFDRTGKPTEIFGLTASYESRVIEANTTFSPVDPAYFKVNLVRRFPYEATKLISGALDRVVMRMFVLPVGLEVLDELVKTGDLDPKFVDAMKPMQVGETVQWTPAAAAAANLAYRDAETRGTFRCVTASNASSIVTSDKTPVVKSPRCR